MSQPDKKPSFSLASLRRVLRFARPYKRTFWGSIALAVLLAALTPVRPYLIQMTLKDFVAKGLAHAVITVTIYQIAFLVLETALRFVFSYLTSWLGQAVVKDLRVTTYRKVLGLNLRQFDRTPIGTLTTRTVDDIERINDIFADGLIPILADLLSIVCVLAYMFWANWQLTLVCLIPFPVLIVATYYFKESVNKSFHRVRNAVSALNAFVQEHITGMYVVQAFAAEEREMKQFDKINREHRDANIHSIFAYSVFFPVVEIILATSTGLIVWFVAHPNVEEGIITSFILCLNLLFRPLRVIADKFNTLQMGLIAGDRVFKVLDNEDVTQNTGGYAPQQVAGRIDFEGVTFGYGPESTVLHDVSFAVPPGQTLAIVGHTGSGKTTIISLLNRLYEVQAGTIRVDGVAVGEWQLDALRANVGVVLQDVFLFSGSVRDNLTLRNPEIPQERVEAAAKLIGMHDFILSLPGGYDYNVMERGATLSLGQRQLLSFIRALLYNPAILVLDEATSSIDTESEALIEHAIRTLVAGRTSIIIAHRLSTIQRADQILVLDKGEVKETGTHAELLRRSGFYARLYEMQFEQKINSPAGR
ncbi:MAG: ABC transporter ATP-binding protein [Chitinophagaceae bacterium]|nr:MAG: ABC transporter ATP-binding protein [Chitinophagaceae bacterium]